MLRLGHPGERGDIRFHGVHFPLLARSVRGTLAQLWRLARAHFWAWSYDIPTLSLGKVCPIEIVCTKDLYLRSS